MMPSPRRHYRKGGNAEEKMTKKGRSIARSKSFDFKVSSSVGFMLQRPRTVPDLAGIATASGGGGITLPEVRENQPQKLTKLLLNVTIQRSIGPVHLLMSPESTVGDIIASAVQQYAKEGRRPTLQSADPVDFDLHYSQFSLESLNREEKLAQLGSRNFFVCPKRCRDTEVIKGDGINVPITATSCSEEAQKFSNVNLPLVDFMFIVMKYSM